MTFNLHSAFGSVSSSWERSNVGHPFHFCRACIVHSCVECEGVCREREREREREMEGVGEIDVSV